LNEIIDYIAEDSLEYALSFYEEVREKVGNLVQFPKMGRKVPELNDPKFLDVITNFPNSFQTFIINLIKFGLIQHNTPPFP